MKTIHDKHCECLLVSLSRNFRVMPYNRLALHCIGIFTTINTNTSLRLGHPILNTIHIQIDNDRIIVRGTVESLVEPDCLVFHYSQMPPHLDSRKIQFSPRSSFARFWGGIVRTRPIRSWGSDDTRRNGGRCFLQTSVNKNRKGNGLSGHT